MGLLKYNLYKQQQRFLNPDNIPKKSKTSLYQISPRHLELWIENSFIQPKSVRTEPKNWQFSSV
ncbi:hypothetical protein RhiirA4_469654 [Rhizophagus irregularis]|uniref:Uncharacterized protein n=1 Tax=Rhizophagus irregularis TaxID=588596 RepID=A0A2I1GZW5_9GLOM|nr:hypothetical protein RhiirA4_469654 [Rhizophagus irregularis]